MPNLSYLYTFYAITLFLSSFLLFQIQPLMGKHLLPWFGGSSAVWITVMFFFIVVLALGYLYALFLSAINKKIQIIIHGILLGLVTVLIYRNGLIWPSAVTPTFFDVGFQGFGPVLAVSLVLMTSVGAPFLLLSSSSSLLQYWYGSETGREPFSLYSISNAGSLLGLVSYPLVFERSLVTYEQGWWWSMGLYIYIFFMIGILFLYSRKISFGEKKEVEVNHRRDYGADMSSEGKETVTARQFLWWTGLAGIPVITMLAGTSYITGYVASVPFLWIIPLGLYLTSFILSFREGFRLSKLVSYVFVLFSSLIALIAVMNHFIPAPYALTAIFLAMFSIYHVCHEALYGGRPKTRYLTLFYVALSFGGIIASVLMIVFMYLINFPFELIFILVGAGIFSVIWLNNFLCHSSSVEILSLRYGRYGLMFGGAAMVLMVVFYINNILCDVVDADRNFFGYKAVLEVIQADGFVQRGLVHGTTNHGYQIFHQRYEGVPVAYYSETSGVGKGFAYLREIKPKGLRIGIAGLGVGTLAGYCLPEDTFVFYEIDPQVIDIAYGWFTYLDNCQGSEVKLGDARILIENEVAQGVDLYDYLIIDAYADDLTPIHLMTAEAIASYLPLLKEEGLLVIHISSRYLNLLPVVAGLAESNNLVARYLEDDGQAEYALRSTWALLAKEDVFEHEAFRNTLSLEGIEKIYWTDIYSSLLPILKW